MDSSVKKLIRSMNTFLQQHTEKPSYIIRLKRPDRFYESPVTLLCGDSSYGNTDVVVSIESSGSDQFGAESATITIENANGLHSPDWVKGKQPENVITKDWKLTYWENFFLPETHIQIMLGYGSNVVPVLTGAIDDCVINEKDCTITLNVRDNMRYLIDQHIDGAQFGTTLEYPRTDVLYKAQVDQLPVTKTVKVKGINKGDSLNIRSGPNTTYDIIGSAYNGDTFLLVDEIDANTGVVWYKIKFGDKEGFIYSAYADVVSTNAKLTQKMYVRPSAGACSKELPVFAGPGASTGIIAHLNVPCTPKFIESKKASDGSQWDRIYYSGIATGWVHDLYTGSSDTGIPDVADVHGYIEAKSSASDSATSAGYVYSGNSYEYVKTVKVGTVNWHEFIFTNEKNAKVHGFLKDGDCNLIQRTSNISYGSVVYVQGSSSHVHIRSGPGIQYSVVKEAYNTEVYAFLGTVSGSTVENDGFTHTGMPDLTCIVWSQVMYEDANGLSKIGYINSAYCNLQSGYKLPFEGNPESVTVPENPSGDIMIDFSTTSNNTEAWTAQSIVMDLCILATTIGFNGGLTALDRSVCNVYCEDFFLEENGEKSQYIIREASFKCTETYYDSAMKIVNQLGDVIFKADAFGNIVLKRNRKYTEEDLVDFELYDYYQISSSSLNYDVKDVRNRIIVMSENGTSMFEMKQITARECRGVNRTMSVKVSWADTVEKRKLAALSAFQQVLTSYRTVSIGIIGNPLIKVGDLVRLHNLNSTAAGVYVVKEFKHNFTTDSGFITTLELKKLILLHWNDVSLVTEDFPVAVKKFEYNLPLQNNKRQMKIKLNNTIYKATIKMYCYPDALLAPGETAPEGEASSTEEQLVATVNIVGDTFEQNPVGNLVTDGDSETVTVPSTVNVQQMLLTKNQWSRPGTHIGTIKKIVIHWVGNPNTSAQANRNYFESLKNQRSIPLEVDDSLKPIEDEVLAKSGRYASSHYIVGLQGEVIMCVPETEVAYHANSANSYSIGIENCHPDSVGKFNNQTYGSLIALCADICVRYNLDPLTALIRHYDVTGKMCPLYYVNNPSAWVKLKNDVKSAVSRLKKLRENPIAERDSEESQDMPDTETVTVNRDEIRIRTTPSVVGSENIKRVSSVGESFPYLGTSGDFYKIQDTDGTTAYIFASYCSISHQTGTASKASLASTGAPEYFVAVAAAQVGQGYTWGADGQVMTEAFYNSQVARYGSSNVSSTVKKWMGKRVFDCGGLVCWCMRKMNLFASNEDYTSRSLYSICQHITKSQLKAGDLVFRTNRSGGIYHVAIYAGNNEMIEASCDSAGVVRSTLRGELFGRLWKLANATTYSTVENVDTTLAGSGDTINADLTGIDSIITGAYIPATYKITTSFDVSNPPADVTDLINRVHGKLLMYLGNPVLYNITVESDGGTKNVLVLHWAPRKVDTTRTRIRFEILLY